MRLTIAAAPSEWSRFADGSVERRMLITAALGGWVAVAAADLGIEVYVFDGERMALLNRG